MPCCTPTACWKSRCTPVGDTVDGQPDEKDLMQHRCNNFVTYDLPRRVDIGDKKHITEILIPKCQNLISASDIVNAVKGYYTGGLL